MHDKGKIEAAAASGNRRQGVLADRRPIGQDRASQRMIPKSMSSTPIGDGHRFSEKIMRN
jgi:hypothetical protein